MCVPKWRSQNWGHLGIVARPWRPLILEDDLTRVIMNYLTFSEGWAHWSPRFWDTLMLSRWSWTRTFPDCSLTRRSCLPPPDFSIRHTNGLLSTVIPSRINEKAGHWNETYKMPHRIPGKMGLHCLMVDVLTTRLFLVYFGTVLRNEVPHQQDGFALQTLGSWELMLKRLGGVKYQLRNARRSASVNSVQTQSGSSS